MMKSMFMKVKESRWTVRLLSPVLLLVLMLLFAATTNGRFANPRNLQMLLDQSLVVATVAAGAVFIFATGNVNISMGASTALVATFAAMVYVATGSVALMLIVALALGLVLMILTALLSTWLRVPVLFVTVVMMMLLAALQKAILGATTITVPYAWVSALRDANLPYILFAVFFLFCIVLFHFTAVGRKLRYIGINERCAELTGFSAGRNLFLASLISGIGVGFGAAMTIIRAGSISTDTCGSLNLDVMLAIVLGGMSCFGGSRSNVWSAIVGALIVTVLNNGMLMLGVSNTVLQGIRGVIFIILVYASQTRPQGLPTNEV